MSKREPLKPEVIEQINELGEQWNEMTRKVLIAAMSHHAMTYDERAIKLLKSKFDYNTSELHHFLFNKKT